MADITVTIADQFLPTIEAAFTQSFGYQASITETDPETGEATTHPNPETPADFTKRCVLKYIQDVTRAYLVNKAQAEAAAAAAAHAESITL